MKKSILRTLCIILSSAFMIISMAACQQADAGADQPPENNGNNQNVPAANFLVETKARVQNAESKTWCTDPAVSAGDVVEIQVQYANLDEVNHRDVAVIVGLPDGVEFVSGSTKFFNGSYPDGKTVEEDFLITEGILVGNYSGYNPDIIDASTIDNSDSDTTDNSDSPRGANFYVRFAVTIKEDVAEIVNLPVSVKVDATRADANESTMVCGFIYLSIGESI